MALKRIAITATGVWTKPADCPSVVTRIECIGPGGNGFNTRRSSVRGAPGGGGGEYAAETNVNIGSGGQTVTVPAGGSAAATTFPATGVTITANPGGNATSTVVGSGGTGSTNTVHFNGGAGFAPASTVLTGGGGGGAGGPSGAGGTAPSQVGGTADNGTVTGGAAATIGNSGTEWSTVQGVFGVGSGGGGGASASATPGGNGGPYGGGSGGHGNNNTTDASTGGAGLVIVTYDPIFEAVLPIVNVG